MVLSYLLRLTGLNGRHKALHYISNKFCTRPHPTSCCPYLGSLDNQDTSKPIQQDDISKKFYMTIVNHNLKTAYDKYGPSYPIIPSTSRYSDKSVIIVGAGVAGLAAAFELKKVGYKVQIVELQHRVGGRTKTLRSGFSDGLHAEGGAMRIPPNHFLTHGYMLKFGIALRPFVNDNGNGWLYLRDEEKIRIKDWEDNNKFYSDKFFPGWNPTNKNVNGLLDLHEKTMEPVKKDLIKKIAESGTQDGWAAWVEQWSKLSVNDFLRSNTLEFKYLPWSEVAIRGYQTTTYSPGFDMSLVEYLRDDLGKWWRDELETTVDGIDTLAKHFIKPHNIDLAGEKEIDLADKITFGTKVHTIKKTSENEVEVIGRNNFTGEETTFTAGAVIVTTPLTILRQIDIDLTKKQERAIANIYYGASTKIVLQCRSRFWEKDGSVGQGGFSKTDLPIGQLHYPSPDDPPYPNKRGLLVCYTWDQDALIFGAQSEKEAIASAVKEVTKIHPEMETEFEVGMVQAWFSDPASQGAYASLRPYQYNDGMKTLMTPVHPIYLAGEAISYTNAWIQGALESGLNAAYHLYSYNMPYCT